MHIKQREANRLREHDGHYRFVNGGLECRKGWQRMWGRVEKSESQMQRKKRPGRSKVAINSTSGSWKAEGRGGNGAPSGTARTGPSCPGQRRDQSSGPSEAASLWLFSSAFRQGENTRYAPGGCCFHAHERCFAATANHRRAGRGDPRSGHTRLPKHRHSPLSCLLSQTPEYSRGSFAGPFTVPAGPTAPNHFREVTGKDFRYAKRKGRRTIDTKWVD